MIYSNENKSSFLLDFNLLLVFNFLFNTEDDEYDGNAPLDDEDIEDIEDDMSLFGTNLVDEYDSPFDFEENNDDESDDDEI